MLGVRVNSFNENGLGEPEQDANSALTELDKGKWWTQALSKFQFREVRIVSDNLWLRCIVLVEVMMAYRTVSLQVFDLDVLGSNVKQ